MAKITRDTLRKELKEVADETVVEVKQMLDLALGRELQSLRSQIEDTIWTAIGVLGSRPPPPTRTMSPLPGQFSSTACLRSSTLSNGLGATTHPQPLQTQQSTLSGAARARMRVSQAPTRASIAAPLLGMDGDGGDSQPMSWFSRHRKGFSYRTTERSKHRSTVDLDSVGSFRASSNVVRQGSADRDASYVPVSTSILSDGEDEEAPKRREQAHTDETLETVNTESAAATGRGTNSSSQAPGAIVASGVSDPHSQRSRKLKASTPKTLSGAMSFHTKESAWERAAQKRASTAADPTSRLLMAAALEDSEETWWIPAVVLQFAWSPVLDYMSICVIIINAVVLGVQTDYMARFWADTPPMWSQVVELICCAYFVLEVCFRLLLMGCRGYFCGEEWFCNLFDVLLVVVQVMDDALSAGGNSPYIRMVRILRLLRLVRIVRILHLFGDLRMLLIAIWESGRSVCWCVVLLGLMTFCISVYLTQVVTDHKLHNNMGDDEAKLLESFFGTLDVSMLSLYQMISEGIHWHQVLEPLQLYCSPWLALVFVVYMGFTVFAVLNVVTGVFVDTAMQSAQEDRRKVLMEQMRQFFYRADEDGSGTISKDEFQAQIDSKEMQTMLKAVDLDQDEAVDLFNLLDMSERGELEVDSFVHGVQRLSGYAKAIELAAFIRGWKHWVGMWQIHAVFLEESMENLMNVLQEGDAAEIWQTENMGAETGDPVNFSATDPVSPVAQPSHTGARASDAGDDDDEGYSSEENQRCAV